MDKEIKTVEEFVERLAEMKCGIDCENQYAGENAERTRNNLTLYLKAMKEKNPKVLFLGEAPSWKGCTITGIPFTDDVKLSDVSFLKDINGLETSGSANPHSEGSATIVWEIINDNMDNAPLLWNIYPFHPYKLDDGKQTNREPTADEVSQGCLVVDKLLELFPSIKYIYGIGETALRYLYIRHPSYGGADAFKKRATEILKSKI